MPYVYMIQKQFALNRKLYVAFIDFEKAFVSILRKLLWPILLKNGIKGRLYKCVRSMYENVKAKIRCGAKFTDYINCTRGVKQGDVCSPALFSLFINELALDIINIGKHGMNKDTEKREVDESIISLEKRRRRKVCKVPTWKRNLNMSSSS